MTKKAQRRGDIDQKSDQTVLIIAAGLAAQSIGAQVDFYETDAFRGRVLSTHRAVSDFRDQGFNDRALSAVVQGGRWEVYDNVDFGGNCVVLRVGR